MELVVEDSSNYNIIFNQDIRDISSNDILIYPSYDNWNDFGFKLKCTCCVINKKTGELVKIGAYIGFLPMDKENFSNDKHINEYSRELSQGFSKGSLSEAVFAPLDGKFKNSGYVIWGKVYFFTMLPSMADYRSGIEKLGVEQFGEFLRAINDLVLFKDSSEEWVSQAVSSEVFRLGFMRHSEGFFAFSNADSVLSGVEEEYFGGISQNLSFRFTLDGFKNEHCIELKYNQESLIPKRINILIGKNGLGKSQALRSFCRAALQYRDSSISLVDSNSNDRPMINRLLAIATPGETQNTFPGERISTQKLYYRRLSLTRNGRAKRTRSINELIIQLIRSEEVVGRNSRWNLFTDALSKVLHFDKLVLQTNNGSYIHLCVLDKMGGEQASLEKWAEIDANSEPKFLFSNEPRSLSSGQLTFLKFALLSCLYIENGSFVLLDEPETHMHPNMISDFVGLLDQLLEETGSQALIATHSVYFVREVSREQVHVFSKEDDDRILIVSPRLRTFGADVESISQFVFNEDVDNHLIDKIFDKVKKIPFEQIEKELSDELSMSALLNLKARMGDE